MSEETGKPTLNVSFEGFDPMGFKSAAELSKEATKFGLEAAKVFLNATCKPLLEEFGLGLRDKFTNWRLSNVISMLEKAQGKLMFDPETQTLKIDPRVAYQIVENVSTISDDNLQEMWAGLFAASCQNYEEDENIFFTDMLKRLTSAQVKFLNHLCLTCHKRIEISRLPESRIDGEVLVNFIEMSYDDILKIMGTQSRLKADSEFMQLEKMGLIQIYISGGQNPGHLSLMQNLKLKKFNIKPTTPTLSLFVKCQGSCATPFDYFLADMLVYYRSLLSDYAELPGSKILAFMETEAQKQIEYTIERAGTTHGLTYMLKTNGPIPDINKLSSILRTFIIKYWIGEILQSTTITINGDPYGVFEYKVGFTSIFNGKK